MTRSNDDQMYVVLLLRPGESHAHRRHDVRGWEQAVAEAHTLITDYDPDLTPVVWLGAEHWNEHDDAAPGMRPCGGYDAGPEDAETAAAIIYSD